MQAAIEEIKRLKKQNDTLRRRFDKMKSVFDEREFTFVVYAKKLFNVQFPFIFASMLEFTFRQDINN